MKRLIAYWFALRPRTGLWFFLQIVALTVPTPITVGALEVAGWRIEVWPMVALELSILLGVLFVSGFVAWSKEQEKTRDKWPHLSSDSRRQFSQILQTTPEQGMRYVLIHHNTSQDCEDLAAQIHDAVIAAGWGAQFVTSDRPWSPGLIIAVRGGEQNQNANALRDAFKSIDLAATIATSNDIQLRILLGSKP